MDEPTEKREKNSHCSYCGHPFPAGLLWPRRCERCANVSYVNPLPVCVVLVPVDEGLLLVRRTIPPRQGSLALPGGFISLGESWQEAGAREVREETGLPIDPGEVRLYDARSAPDGTLLIFALARPRSRADLPPFAANDETSETVIGSAPLELAFPLHTLVATRYYQERAGTGAGFLDRNAQ